MQTNSFLASKTVGFLKSKYFGLVLILVLVLTPQISSAQCAMCRAVLESEGSGDTARGINNGIVYLMAVPYLLVAGVFTAIYMKMRNKKNNKVDTSIK